MSERFELIEPHLGDKYASDWSCRRLSDGRRAIVDFVTSSELDPDALKPGMVIECVHTHAYIEIAVAATIVTDAAAINAVLARHRDLAGANGRPEGGA